MKRLSETAIEKAVPAEGARECMLYDAGCPGLYIRITRTARTFYVQWTDPATRKKGRDRIGAFGALSVEQARDAARIRLALVAQGSNPIAERSKIVAEAKRIADENALTLDGLIKEWVAIHLTERRPRYRSEAERALRVGFEDLLDRPAARINRGDVLRVLDAMTSTGKSVLAARTLAYGRAAYAWAGRRGRVVTNPFQGLPVMAAAKPRERTLTDAETWELWATLDSMKKPFGPAIQFLLLTMARRDEVAAMCWSELEHGGSRWVIPSARTKNGKPHVVHLPELAQYVLRKVERVNGQALVFSTTGETPISGWSKAKLAIDAGVLKARIKDVGAGDAKPMPQWTSHDFRRTGVSFLASAGFDPIVANKLLNHQPAQLRGVAAVYQRYSFDAERAKALDAWAAHVAGEPIGTNVVQLVRAG